jgi:DNA-binding transcriptional regulator/RsmH inhibitor MraZ
MPSDFIGTIHDNAVHKSRIMIPAKFKKKFALEANEIVVVTIGPNGTVAIFPMDSWLFITARLQASELDRHKKLLANLFDFAMPEQALEGPGRIRISEELMHIAKIKDSVSIKGEGRFMTVWNSEILKEIKQKKSEDHRETYDSTDYR